MEDCVHHGRGPLRHLISIISNKRKSHLQQHLPDKGQGNQRLRHLRDEGLCFSFRQVAYIPTREPAKCEGTLDWLLEKGDEYHLQTWDPLL